MSWLTNLEAAIKAEFAKVEPTLAAIWKAIKPMVEATAEEVAQIALKSVTDNALEVLSGAEKLSVGVNAVVTTLASQGKSVTVTNAETAVQSAYNILSANIPKPAV